MTFSAITNTVRRRSYGLYLFIILALLLPAVIILILNYWILYQAGERQTPSKIAYKLQDGQTIFASGLQDMRREINLESYRLRAPEIIAFGSSRPLNFRQEFFDASFSCACGAVPDLLKGKIYAESLLKIHTPRVVIFSLDFWWFTTRSGIHPRPMITGAAPLNLQKLTKPMKLIANGTLSPQQFWQLLKSGNDFTATTSYKKEGLLAITRGMGLRGDGSYLGGMRLSDNAKEYYKPWAGHLHNTANFIRTNDRYGPDQSIIEQNIKHYAALVKFFQDQGIQVVSVILPFAPPIYEQLQKSSNHDYFFELPQKISLYSDEFYNFGDPSSVGANTCEFEDTHHSGDTVMMRVLREIIQLNPTSAIGPYVDQNKLGRYIREFEGRTIAMFDRDAFLSKERDFLEFGCEK